MQKGSKDGDGGKMLRQRRKCFSCGFYSDALFPSTGVYSHIDILHENGDSKLPQEKAKSKDISNYFAYQDKHKILICDFKINNKNVAIKLAGLAL